MKEEKDKTVKYFEFFCCNEQCNHEWISKTHDLYCPQCKGTILDFAKLR
jgi:Zn finger protein HypA/HybF involved in hydrogenase expression